MLLISPIDHGSEVGALLEAGAEELYGGYVPADWQERFSLLTSINQRTFAGAQIDSAADLGTIVSAVHAVEKRFLLTLNAPFYTDEQLPLLDAYVDEAVGIGIDGVILADIGLLRRLRRQFPDLELHASTLAHLGNSAAIRCYVEAGVKRVIFPRHIPVGEMAEMVAANPEVRFDCFFLVGKCPNTEGLCTFHHSSPDKIWPCEIPYEIEPFEAFSEALEQAMERQRSWSRTNRRHGCGLCAVPHLLRAGLYGLKLVGRGAPTAQKVANLQLAATFQELATKENAAGEYRRQAMLAHKERFGAGCSPNVCYYPEFYQGE